MNSTGTVLPVFMNGTAVLYCRHGASFKLHPTGGGRCPARETRGRRRGACRLGLIAGLCECGALKLLLLLREVQPLAESPRWAA